MQKISNYTIFFQISLGEHTSNPPPPPSRASLSCGYIYVQRITLTHANLHFRIKILTLYQNLYTLMAFMSATL